MIDLENFLIIEKVGAGSYSTVYKAQTKSVEKENVAIKVVEKAKLSIRGKENIITEIKVMKMLKHKHVVEMKDFIWDAKNIYIIMEYCDGGDLSSFIKRRCKLPEKVCQKFLQQLAIGLQFLHSQNICHLDLKPQNLLIITQPKITLKIGDFGFAQFLEDSIQKNSIRGSPLYMAPEMLLGGKYDAKADLWSVGIITYECLFGKAPYSSGTYEELCNKIKSKLKIVIPDNIYLSEECKDFLNNLLLHDPERRMSYEMFFNHPFLDLKYAPSEANYKKAIKILADAENLDKTSHVVEAFNKYCEGLQYLFPIYNDETLEHKKIILKSKVIRYTKRAEELKNVLHLNGELRIEVSTEKQLPNSLKSTPCINPENTSGGTDETDTHLNLTETVSKCFSLKHLLSLCVNTPQLFTAIEIGISAQMYLVEGKYELAFEKFRSSLGILIPSLSAEPHGLRKELLYLQIQEWMKQAESTKSLLSLKKNEIQQIGTDYKGKKKKLRNQVLLKFLSKNN